MSSGLRITSLVFLGIISCTSGGEKGACVLNCSDEGGADSGLDVSRDAPAESTDASPEQMAEASVLPDGGLERWCPAVGTPRCGAPAQCGPIVDIINSTLAPPTPQGGTIVDGLYFLTKYTVYGAANDGPLGQRIQAAWSISNGTFATQGYVDAQPDRNYSGTLAPTGTSVTETETCPGTGSQTLGYTAMPTEFIRYRGGGKWELVYTKQ